MGWINLKQIIDKNNNGPIISKMKAAILKKKKKPDELKIPSPAVNVEGKLIEEKMEEKGEEEEEKEEEEEEDMSLTAVTSYTSTGNEKGDPVVKKDKTSGKKHSKKKADKESSKKNALGKSKKESLQIDSLCSSKSNSQKLHSDSSKSDEGSSSESSQKSNSQTNEKSENAHESSSASKSGSKESSESASKSKESSKSASQSKESSNSPPEAKESSKSGSKSKESTESASKSKESSKSPPEAKESSKSGSKSKESTESASKSKESTKSASKSKESTKSASKSKESSKSASDDSEESKPSVEEEASDTDTSKSKDQTVKKDESFYDPCKVEPSIKKERRKSSAKYDNFLEHDLKSKKSSYSERREESLEKIDQLLAKIGNEPIDSQIIPKTRSHDSKGSIHFLPCDPRIQDCPCQCHQKGSGRLSGDKKVSSDDTCLCFCHTVQPKYEKPNKRPPSYPKDVLTYSEKSKPSSAKQKSKQSHLCASSDESCSDKRAVDFKKEHGNVAKVVEKIIISEGKGQKTKPLPAQESMKQRYTAPTDTSISYPQEPHYFTVFPACNNTRRAFRGELPLKRPVYCVLPFADVLKTEEFETIRTSWPIADLADPNSPQMVFPSVLTSCESPLRKEAILEKTKGDKSVDLQDYTALLTTLEKFCNKLIKNDLEIKKLNKKIDFLESKGMIPLGLV